MKKAVAKTIAMVAKRTAAKSANSTCVMYFYQSKEPKAVKKLRKF